MSPATDVTPTEDRRPADRFAAASSWPGAARGGNRPTFRAEDPTIREFHAEDLHPDDM
jgi:hypothetical protein